MLTAAYQELHWRNRMAKKTIGQQFRKLCLFIPFSIALSGMAVIAYQSYFWLKLGHWKPLDSRLILNIVLPTNFLQWLHNPSSWVGIKKVIVPVFNFPLAVFLLLFSFVVLLLITKTFDSFSKPERIKKIEVKLVRKKNWRCA
jgi:hypothetical protein